MWCLSSICTNSPSLNKAILGEEGGKGTIKDLALLVASISKPANTVYKLSGFLLFAKLILAPGLAFAAAQPQTEFTTTRAVPGFAKAASTSSGVCNSSKPTFVNSSFIGFTNSAGYIIISFFNQFNIYIAKLMKIIQVFC